jgi:uncharacterized membrane protein SirB2
MSETTNPSGASADRAESTAVAFGISAAVTVLFNTLLTWVKEGSESVHDLMVVITGHHWWTQGLFDLIVFVVVGWVLMRRGGQKHLTDGLAYTLTGAVVVAGLGIAGFFLLE